MQHEWWSKSQHGGQDQFLSYESLAVIFHVALFVSFTWKALFLNSPLKTMVRNSFNVNCFLCQPFFMEMNGQKFQFFSPEKI